MDDRTKRKLGLIRDGSMLALFASMLKHLGGEMPLADSKSESKPHTMPHRWTPRYATSKKHRDRSLSGRQRRLARKAARAAQQVKVYVMNDSDWYAARSPEEAIAAMRENMGYETDAELLREGLLLEPVFELTNSDLDTLQFRDEDGATRTFRQQLALLIAHGQKFPYFFASTEC